MNCAVCMRMLLTRKKITESRHLSTADEVSNLVNCLRQEDEDPKNLETELTDFQSVPSK